MSNIVANKEVDNTEEVHTSIVKFTTTMATLFIIAIMLIPAFVEPDFSFRKFHVGFADISIGAFVLLVGGAFSFSGDMDRRNIVTAWLLVAPIIAIQVISGQTFNVFDAKLFALMLASIAAIIGIVGLLYMRKQLRKSEQVDEWRKYLSISKLVVPLITSAYFVIYIFIAVIEETLLFDYQMLYPILLWFLLLNSGLMLLTFGEKKNQAA
ncbi:hypothetical protein [Paenibacillus sp. L3-i20]|uniref:hypothetical protein n=1 Tax=Paenibacillus sp. L3-i20 TaxID=2905833 RepID=UPI001EDFEE01|nr:hypothetical protein [Paenibacillus sp. L3-i20]GKU78803.1 hypothetical protein L3i20_v232000 [Paenibacillus sp. L3-i20]